MAYHINSKGEAGICHAAQGKCPFGETTEHFATAVDARRAFENKMAQELAEENNRKFRERYGHWPDDPPYHAPST